GRAQAPPGGGARPPGPARPRGAGPAPLRATVQPRGRPRIGPGQVGRQQALRAGPGAAEGRPGRTARRAGGWAVTGGDAERDRVEQLADSFLARYRAGERPGVEEYAAKYPELADEVRELLRALVLMEQNAPSEAGPAAGSPPQQLGDFVILREIG